VALSILNVDDIRLHEIMLREHAQNRVHFLVHRIVSGQYVNSLFQFRLALGIEPGVLPGCTRSAFRVIDGLNMDPAISQY
jgi:hypothetical protein